MKLRNKKTGEIVDFETGIYADTEDRTYEFSSIADLNEHLEDAPEEPKEYWYIYGAEPFEVDEQNMDKDYVAELKSIGNYFNTREEAEQAVEKLKAWKRLKDKGITFEAKVIDRKWYIAPKANPSQRTFDEAHDTHKDLMIIFGGK